MSHTSDLGSRMKDYEAVTASLVAAQSHLIIRLDGRNFHAWTRGMNRPFDRRLALGMDQAAKRLCEEIAGASFGYVQSDEISIYLAPSGNPQTEVMFGGKVQKIVSVTASMVTAFFNDWFSRFPDMDGRPAQFDSRIFTLPNRTEVENYFVWRQRDAVRNSISMAAQANFSHRQLQGVNTDLMQEMLFSKGINWNDYEPRFKRGGEVIFTRTMF